MSNPKPSRYEDAGVSIDAGQQTVDLIKKAVQRTHGPNVLAGVGAFGGLFALDDLGPHPALVASTDGVGTKVALAAQRGRYRSIGHDLVNHCVNDILCAGADVKPLFFLDYVASGRLEPAHVAATVTGLAEACEAVGCALLGGETAEMPGVYQPGAFDLVGTIVGLVDHTRRYPFTSLSAGDVLLALPSSGPHTNGYSLIRKLVENVSLDEEIEGVGKLGEVVLEPHRCYLADLRKLATADVLVHSLAHITGGGLVDNLPRALPDGLSARIDTSSWTVPPLFRFLQQQGDIDTEEMFRVFNMGVGMIAVIPADACDAALVALSDSWLIGEVVEGDTLQWT
ncbi:MAG: phosphoribosylformylglycinamidine cyclo-ligase [Trueperaceae bacterium]|nr:phosphoribosylformylglycinamidine cyclo-ligase [Trueperaceae bacterium]